VPEAKLASAARLMRVFFLETLLADEDRQSRPSLGLETGEIED